MIDYQPSHGLRHCHCTDLRDGFTESQTLGTYVHAACGKPRPTVHTNLHQLPAPVIVPIEPDGTFSAAVPALTDPGPPVPLPVPIEITPEQDAAFTELVQLGQEIEQTPEPPAEQPKRRRGRPPKDTKGYALEKRDAPDRWCVIREATGEIMASGLTSKAKATECMDDLIRKADDDGSPATPVALPAAQPQPDARSADTAEPAPAAGPAAEDVPAAPGQPVGPAAGGVRAVVAGGYAENEAARGAEDVDQGGAGPAVPGAGSGGDQPVTDAATAALPAGQGEGGPGSDREDVPGDLGPVHDGGNQLGAGQALTLECGEQPVIHGPKGDCPECFRLWDWCPASVNPEPAQTSPDTSGQGSMPATVALTGSNWLQTGVQQAEAQQPVSPQLVVNAEQAGYLTAKGVPGSGIVVIEPSTELSPPVDNPGTVMWNAQGGQAATVTAVAQPLPGSVIDSSKPSLAAFMSAAKHVAQSGNTPWAAQYANELRQIVIDRANNAPRNLQRHLGPSEIGSPCDRQVVGKLAGFEKTNHVTDAWPSLMGTAGHAWMEDCFKGHNTTLGWQRWLVEQRVTPHPDHAGTSDLYDVQNLCVNDHKFLGETQMAKLRADKVPPKYFFQLLTYRRGYQLMGLRVDRIVIIGWPRTGSSVDGMYVWEHPCTPADDAQLDQLFARMDWRKQWAAAINAGNARLSDVPAVPDDDECYFCPFYRPQSARDGGPGCPGHAGV